MLPSKLPADRQPAHDRDRRGDRRADPRPHRQTDRDCESARARRGRIGETGSASLEFITAGLILLVPLVYLILAMAALQGGSLALEGAARHAARVYVQAPSEAEGVARVNRVVAFAMADYGLGDVPSVRIDCDGAGACLTRQGRVTVTIRADVPMPLVPSFVSDAGATSIPIEASASQVVSRFWGASR